MTFPKVEWSVDKAVVAKLLLLAAQKMRRHQLSYLCHALDLVSNGDDVSGSETLACERMRSDIYDALQVANTEPIETLDDWYDQVGGGDSSPYSRATTLRLKWISQLLKELDHDIPV